MPAGSDRGPGRLRVVPDDNPWRYETTVIPRAGVRAWLSGARTEGSGDILVFGRRARGERFTRGFLREVWQVRREGRLVWGDALHLEDDIARIIDDPACFDGAAAFATIILAPAGREARDFVESARAIQSVDTASELRAGVTTIAGLVIARWLAADAALLRRGYADLACHLRQAAMGLPPLLPRLWHV